MTTALIFQLQSVIIVNLMLYGLFMRKERATHMKTMKVVIVWDLLLILQIELSREAIIKASNIMSNPMILNIHVSLAVATVLLYGMMAYTGYKLSKGIESIRRFHRPLGYVTLTARLATFATSFLIAE